MSLKMIDIKDAVFDSLMDYSDGTNYIMDVITNQLDPNFTRDDLEKLINSDSDDDDITLKFD